MVIVINFDFLHLSIKHLELDYNSNDNMKTLLYHSSSKMDK